MKEYSKSKYHTFTSFRNRLKISSMKRYASNPLFRCHLQSYLKKQYHENTEIQAQKKQRVAISRHSISASIQKFTKNISETPKYICTVCARILYRSKVKLCKRDKYTLTDTVTKCLTGDFIHKCDEKECPDDCPLKASSRDEEWICHNCDRYIKNGQMPPQAQANNLYLTPIPAVLQNLNELEIQLIALRIPFMKLLALPRGGHRGVKGPVVNVPSDINKITSSLPRTVNEAQLVPVKLKRKLSYKGHYMYKWINPTHVTDALKYLIGNNPWYEGVTFDESWINSIANSCLIEPDSKESDNDSESDEEPSNQPSTEPYNIPVETCFQPVDIGQDILDTNKIICLAPAEKNKPENIFQEKGSDVMAFPALLPDGQFGLFEDREIKLSPAKYFNARLFSADRRFATNKQFIFFAQYVTEMNYISSNISLALRKGKQTTDDGKPVTASILIDSENLNQILKSDIGYRFLQPVRGTPPYWQRTMKDLYAMIRQLGIPTWFVIFSAAEMRWEEVTRTFLLASNDSRNVEDLDWSDKCALVIDNPVLCARMFDHRVKTLFSDLILSPSNPIGNVVDFFYRTEFQQRGLPHIHCLFWVQDAPKFNENTDEEVCNFIDQYITTKFQMKTLNLNCMIL